MNYNLALEQLLAVAYAGKLIQRIPYAIPLALTILPLQQAVGVFQVNADADFVITHTIQHTNIAGAAQTITTEPVPNCLVQITDSTENRTLFQQPVDLAAMFGTSQTPHWWSEPYLVPANSALSVTLTSYEAANTDVINMVFCGVKVAYAGPAPAPTSNDILSNAQMTVQQLQTLISQLQGS